MNLPYFYEASASQATQFLSEETSKHCVQVLRMAEGEKLQLTDGKGNLYTAVIKHANKKNCEVYIAASSFTQQSTPNISIGISLLKNPTRLEWFVEKATEIGVNKIIPLICERTEKQNFRYDRMNNILVSAMLQSKQTWLPQLYQPIKFTAFINEELDGLKLIAHCIDGEKKTLHEIVDQNEKSNKLILIGPEGDFSKTEIESALQNNFVSVSLGNTRLRTETAGVVAAVLLSL